jgi:PAS domain S-box-containing protein
MARFEMAIDIQDRKVAEEVLRASEEKYRVMVENLNEVIYAADAAGRLTYVSPVSEPITGYTPPEVVGRFFSDFIFTDDLDHIRKRWAEVLSGQVKPTEFRIVKKSGNMMWVRTFSKPVFQDGKAIGLRGVLLDITEYKQTEAALRESEKRYRLLIETMNEGFSINDENGIQTYANKRLCDMLGYEIDEILGYPVKKLMDEEGRKVWAKEFEKRKKRESSPYQMNLIRKDGQRIPAMISPRPIFDEEGNFRGSFAAITDVSHLKKTEKSLKERERELKVKTTNLEEMNAALRVLLRRMEEDRRELEDKVRLNIQQMIQPYLEKLKTAGMSDRQKMHLETLRANLQEILSPFTHNLLADHPILTPSELQIANLLRQGKSSKEIADELSLSARTVETHRRNMRTKLGIKDKKTNLRSYLLSNQYT